MPVRRLRSPCPCYPDGREVAGALRRQLRDVEAFWSYLATEYPDDTSVADLLYRKYARTGKPPHPAGCLGDLDFDAMVAKAGSILFGQSTLGTPDGSGPTKAEVMEASYAKFRFECCRNGYCLRCDSLIEHAARAGEEGKEGQRILRRLLALFDRTGETIPRCLRNWSAESRSQKPPGAARGSKKRTWLRNLWIIYAVASLSYLTGRDATRNDATTPESPCDAVSRALLEDGRWELKAGTVRDLWGDSPSASAMLDRWREQDREEERDLTPRQRDLRRTVGTRMAVQDGGSGGA